MNKKSHFGKRESIFGITTASIPLIGILLFALLPLILSLLVSFSSLKGYDLTRMKFLGFDNLFENYSLVLNDKLFWQSVLNTFTYVISLPISMIVSLFISILIDKLLIGKKLFRLIFFIPYVCSIIAISQAWKVLLNYDYGIINDALNSIFHIRIDWLNKGVPFKIAMIGMSVWQMMGYQIVMFTAGLSNINKSYYEASAIDGAGKVGQFFHVTLPQMSPIIFFVFVTGLIGSLQDFARFQSMTNNFAGPDNAALTMVYYTYKMGFDPSYGLEMGPASAAGWIVGIIVMIFTAINFVFVQRKVSYD